MIFAQARSHTLCSLTNIYSHYPVLPPSDKVADAKQTPCIFLCIQIGLERCISSTRKIHDTTIRVAVYCGSVKCIVPFVDSLVISFIWDGPGETLHRDQSIT